MAQVFKLAENRHERHIKRRKYIHDYARTLMGRLGIKYESFSGEQNAVDVARLLLKRCGREVYAFIDNENDEVQGALALCGVGREELANHSSMPHWGEPQVAMFQVYGGPHWLDGEDHGEALILRMTSVAVIAAMADNIWTEIQKKKARDARFEHTSELRDAIKDFLRSGQ